MKKSQADELEIALRTAHMKRLARNECNTESGIVFLDALVCLGVESFGSLRRNIAEEISDGRIGFYKTKRKGGRLQKAAKCPVFAQFFSSILQKLNKEKKDDFT